MFKATSLFDLSGKTALITGSSQGIGYALAEGLGSAGAQIVLNGRDQAKLETAAERLRGKGLKIETAFFDVTNHGAVAGYRTVVGYIKKSGFDLESFTTEALGSRFKFSLITAV